MLQDPNVERYVENAINPLKKEIAKLKLQIEDLNKALRTHDVSERIEQLSCETCVFNTHSWSEDYPCATCCGFDNHQAT